MARIGFEKPVITRAQARDKLAPKKPEVLLPERARASIDTPFTIEAEIEALSGGGAWSMEYGVDLGGRRDATAGGGSRGGQEGAVQGVRAAQAAQTAPLRLGLNLLLLPQSASKISDWIGWPGLAVG